MSTGIGSASKPSSAKAGIGEPGEARPWTLARIRRGIAWRISNSVLAVRDALLLPIALSSERLSSAFYALASGAFGREHRSVLSGRARFKELSKTSAHHHYQLRRNIHRLEKALIMRPRRPSFAANYINETVDMYSALVDRQRQDPAAVDALEISWAQDVLSSYFSVVQPSGRIRDALDRWTRITPPGDVGARVPYARDLSTPPSVNYDDLHSLAVRRRSVRWYLEKPVPRDLIDKALDVAAMSPSACNRHPIEFRVFDDPESVRRVASIPLGTGGFGHQLPAIAVIVGRLRAFATERDRHLIYIDGGLAAMSFVLALESMGLSSVCINWADAAAQDRQIRELLGLAADERVVMLCAFGYPDPEGMVPFSQKKPLDLFRRYNA